MSKNKIDKNTIPEGFTIPLALVDLLPCIFFAGSGVVLGLILNNLLVEITSFIVFLSGLIKVIWKIIVAIKKKNIWLLFVQMRIVMPLGLLIIIGGIIFSLCANKNLNILVIFNLPQLIFFILGILGIIGMVLCFIKLDSSDKNSNWIEQGINSFAQLCIFLGLLLIYLL